MEITRAEYEEAHRKATERDRTMTVCDVCGVFMTSTDSEARREVRSSPQANCEGFFPCISLQYCSQQSIFVDMKGARLYMLTRSIARWCDSFDSTVVHRLPLHGLTFNVLKNQPSGPAGVHTRALPLAHWAEERVLQ